MLPIRRSEDCALGGRAVNVLLHLLPSADRHATRVSLREEKYAWASIGIQMVRMGTRGPKMSQDLGRGEQVLVESHTHISQSIDTRAPLPR